MMTTAPDPGLTDLIAAHQLVSTDTIFHRNGMVQRPECKCGELMQWAGAYPAHLALVVEQHTNGRITELEAELAEVTDKWGLISHHYRKAEAAIARVRDALTIGPLHRLDLPKYKDPYAIDRHVIRAALEGEQQ